MKFVFLISILFLSGVYAEKLRVITPSDVYTQAGRIQHEIEFLLLENEVKYDYKTIYEDQHIRTPLRPRNVWQLTYEITVKLNMLRSAYNLPKIEPINMEPVLHLNPDLVYEQTQRILTELKILEYRLNLQSPKLKVVKYKSKTPLDVFNKLSAISALLDKLNRTSFTPSYVFGETMRIYDDLTLITNHLDLADKTVPPPREAAATPKDTFKAAMKVLAMIKKIKFRLGLDTVDFLAFKKSNPNPSDVFRLTQMILAELQPLKAYVGLTHSITPAATLYSNKTPADAHQLMQWNLRKLEVLNLSRGKLR